MKLIKDLFYILFLGAIFFVIIGALISFFNFAIHIPLSLLQIISPIKNQLFLLFVSLLIIFLIGLLINHFLTTGIRLGTKKLFENCKAALTQDDKWAFVMSEQPCSQLKIIFFNIWKAFTHPLTGELGPSTKDKLRFVKNRPEEIFAHILSFGTRPLKDLIFEDESEIKSQLTDD